jgi:probable F420-dependent oxidoreductase
MMLSGTGVWWSGSWRAPGDDAGTLEVAAELDTLGYSALWSSGGFGSGLSKHFARLLAATSHITVASGIVTIWHSAPEEIAAAVEELDEKYPGRFLLGLGASHAAVVGDYARPYSHMVAYLDALDTLDALDSVDGGVKPASKSRRVLAALRPRMLELARDRALGAHPYFVPVEHTARARSVLGPTALLAPEVTVVLESDPHKARELARSFTALYLGLPNYVQNLRSLGFDDDDVAAPGSDRLVDAVVSWGDVDSIASKVQEHFDAGADHVCVQVVSKTAESFPIAEYRELAPALVAQGS